MSELRTDATDEPSNRSAAFALTLITTAWNSATLHDEGEKGRRDGGGGAKAETQS